ncbi:hypothetical protein LJC40_03395 [Synergistaceae bacterium OttesenSCG-928-D05]|nr:hypothetical protein [Synergistaceae bacterium OttesenSCG-928-D05]
MTNKVIDDDKLTGFDYFLLLVIACVYPFVAYCLIARNDMIAYAVPVGIFVVASFITYAALRDFLAYYKEATASKK